MYPFPSPRALLPPTVDSEEQTLPPSPAQPSLWAGGRGEVLGLVLPIQLWELS